MSIDDAVNMDDESVDICKLIDWLTEEQKKSGQNSHFVINLKDGRSIVFYLPDAKLSNAIFDKLEKEKGDIK